MVVNLAINWRFIVFCATCANCALDVQYLRKKIMRKIGLSFVNAQDFLRMRNSGERLTCFPMRNICATFAQNCTLPPNAQYTCNICAKLYLPPNAQDMRNICAKLYLPPNAQNLRKVVLTSQCAKFAQNCTYLPMRNKCATFAQYFIIPTMRNMRRICARLHFIPQCARCLQDCTFSSV